MAPQNNFQTNMEGIKICIIKANMIMKNLVFGLEEIVKNKQSN